MASRRAGSTRQKASRVSGDAERVGRVPPAFLNNAGRAMDFINQNATCLDCGYRLAGLESRNCPECGRHIDPLNATTFNDGASPSGWRRWAKPPSRAECLTIGILTLLGVVGASGPAGWGAGNVCCAGVFGYPLCLGLTVVYVMRAIAVYRDRDRARLDLVRQRSTRNWAVLPVCLSIVVSTVITPWPMILRFRASESAFNETLKDYQLERYKKGKWVGLYYVKSVIPRGNQFGRPMGTLFVVEVELSGVYGFEFDPNPNRTTDRWTVRVAPTWYSKGH